MENINPLHHDKYEIFYQGKPGTGKVKEDAKSDNENEEDNKLKDEDLDKTKKEDTPAKVYFVLVAQLLLYTWIPIHPFLC